MPLPKTLDIPPLGPNIKTTIQSLLTALIGLSAIAPSLSILSPHQAALLFSVGACAKVVVGIMQKDAGVTEAVTTTGEVKSVPSHETPDDPTSTPVAEAQPQPEPLHSATVVKGPRVS